MADLSTQYLGLSLSNPIVVGSSPLTDSADKVLELEKQGAAAVVLKSIFEEEISLEYQEMLKDGPQGPWADEMTDYLDRQLRAETLDRYTELVSAAKRLVSIPVIASVNCMYSHEWVYFARQLQSAGADALELNMFFVPSDLSRTSEELEAAYLGVVEAVRGQVSIPVALKVSHYFTTLGQMLQRLSESGIAGLVLFNRFWSPDFDIDTLKVRPGHVLSTPDEMAMPLRWVAIMSNRVSCDLAASTGVHDGDAVIKQILAGAKAVQVVSALMRNGTSHLQVMLDRLDDWMTTGGYFGVDQFRGLMSQATSTNPALYERVQFMRHFGGSAPRS